MKIFEDEKKRRRLNVEFDTKPSINHRRNYMFFKKYIKGKRLLDVGCWTGQFEQLAIKDAKEIVAIDPGKEAIEYAKSRVPKAKFMVGTLETLKLPKNSFDVVVLLDVLEHLPKNTEEKTLKKIYGLLKRGGYFMITTPSSHPISILLDPAFFLIGHRHYSEKELRIFLKKSNFEILDFSIRGGLIQALFNNISILAKYLFNMRIKEGKWLKENIAKEYQSGGFLINCLIAKKIK